MATRAEIFAMQYQQIDHLVPTEVLLKEWGNLRKALAYARMRGNRVEDLRLVSPGVGISLIKEVLILRTFSDAVDAAMKPTSNEGEPSPAEKIAAALKTLRQRLEKFADEAHPDRDGTEAEKSASVILMPPK